MTFYPKKAGAFNEWGISNEANTPAIRLTNIGRSPRNGYNIGAPSTFSRELASMGAPFYPGPSDKDSGESGSTMIIYHSSGDGGLTDLPVESIRPGKETINLTEVCPFCNKKELRIYRDARHYECWSCKRQGNAVDLTTVLENKLEEV